MRARAEVRERCTCVCGRRIAVHQNGLRYRHDPLGDRRRGGPITLCVGSLEPVLPGYVVESLPGYSRQDLRDARTVALFDAEQYRPHPEARPALTAVA